MTTALLHATNIQTTNSPGVFKVTYQTSDGSTAGTILMREGMDGKLAPIEPTLTKANLQLANLALDQILQCRRNTDMRMTPLSLAGTIEATTALSIVSDDDNKKHEAPDLYFNIQSVVVGLMDGYHVEVPSPYLTQDGTTNSTDPNYDPNAAYCGFQPTGDGNRIIPVDALKNGLVIIINSPKTDLVSAKK